MEENNFLNKLLKDTENIVKVVGAQQKTFNKVLPSLKRELINKGIDISVIQKMEDAGKRGDISTLLKLQEELHKNNK